MEVNLRDCPTVYPVQCFKFGAGEGHEGITILLTFVLVTLVPVDTETAIKHLMLFLSRSLVTRFQIGTVEGNSPSFFCF